MHPDEPGSYPLLFHRIDRPPEHNIFQWLFTVSVESVLLSFHRYPAKPGPAESLIELPVHKTVSGPRFTPEAARDIIVLICWVFKSQLVSTVGTGPSTGLREPVAANGISIGKNANENTRLSYCQVAGEL